MRYFSSHMGYVRNVFIFLSSSLLLFAEETPCFEELGNLALPGSQQITPLIAFGQTIIAAGEVQLFLNGALTQGHNLLFVNFNPNLIVGLTDYLAASLYVPVAAYQRVKNHHSAGFGDISMQLEYAYFSRTTPCAIDQATIVGNVSFPSGSSTKNPTTGFGATSYFVGGTYSHMAIKWYFFLSAGGQFTTTHDGYKAGNQFLYEGGLGRNIGNRNGWVYDWLIEMDGFFVERNEFTNHKDPNSGGNLIFLLPSLWASSAKWITQLGVGIPVVQSLNGHQSKENFFVAFNLAYTF